MGASVFFFLWTWTQNHTGAFPISSHGSQDLEFKLKLHYQFSCVSNCLTAGADLVLVSLHSYVIIIINNKSIFVNIMYKYIHPVGSVSLENLD